MKLRNLLLPILPICMLFSCGGNEQYKVEKDSDKFVLPSEGLKTSYNSGDKLEVDTSKYIVTFNGVTKEYLNDNKDIVADKYFFTGSNSSPSASRILPSNTLNTSKPTYEANIYVAILNDNVMYVSNGIKITITNSKALNPILYYVGGGVLIVAIVAMVFFTKRYKERHP